MTAPRPGGAERPTLAELKAAEGVADDVGRVHGLEREHPDALGFAAGAVQPLEGPYDEVTVDTSPSEAFGMGAHAAMVALWRAGLIDPLEVCAAFDVQP